jgi:uncharacterized membrane protein
MNGLAIFAFVIMPMIVVAMGYIAVRLHEASLDRYLEKQRSEGRKTPGSSLP